MSSAPAPAPSPTPAAADERAAWAPLAAAAAFLASPVLGPAEREGLRARLHAEFVGEFMAMGPFPARAGVTVWGYKHITTRRYVFLRADGAEAYTYALGDSGPVYRAVAVRDGIARARAAQ